MFASGDPSRLPNPLLAPPYSPLSTPSHFRFLAFHSSTHHISTFRRLPSIARRLRAVSSRSSVDVQQVLTLSVAEVAAEVVAEVR